MCELRSKYRSIKKCWKYFFFYRCFTIYREFRSVVMTVIYIVTIDNSWNRKFFIYISHFSITIYCIWYTARVIESPPWFYDNKKKWYINRRGACRLKIYLFFSNLLHLLNQFNWILCIKKWCDLQFRWSTYAQFE